MILRVRILPATDKGPRSLSEKRDKIDGLKLTKWKSTRIFFVSSILGLASKKNDPHSEDSWFDLDTFEIYEKNSSLYESGERKLYTYNIIDRSRQYDYDITAQDGVNALLMYNSGLASIELELANYAQRYAQYVKCHEAIKYLTEASELCKENVRTIEDQQKAELDSATARFDEKKHQIVDAMEEQKAAVVKKANELFRLEITKVFEEFKARHRIVTAFLNKGNSFIYTDFQAKWNELKQTALESGSDEKNALQQMQAYVTEQFNQLLNAVSTETNCEIDAFWEARTAAYKRILSTIIMDNPKLNEEQKGILDAIVLNMENMTKERVEFDLREHKGIKMGIIPFVPLGKESYNNSGCCRNFLSEFDKLVKERIEIVRDQNGQMFEAWCVQIINAISDKISTFNEEMHEAELAIAELQKEIDRKNQHIDLLQQTIDYIDNVLCMQRPEAADEE